MHVSRAVVACLLGIYFSLLWREVMGPPPVSVMVELPAAGAAPQAVPVPAPRQAPVVNVIDVAASAATLGLVAQLLRLEGDERLASVDNRPGDHASPWAWLAARFDGHGRGPIARGDHIDLTIEGASGSRRVLVLFH